MVPLGVDGSSYAEALEKLWGPIMKELSMKMLSRGGAHKPKVGYCINTNASKKKEYNLFKRRGVADWADYKNWPERITKRRKSRLGSTNRGNFSSLGRNNFNLKNIPSRPNVGPGSH